MCMDRRFPNLVRFPDYAGADYAVRAKVREVESRTGTNAIINRVTGWIVFRYGDSLGGPLGVSINEVRCWPKQVDPAFPLAPVGVDDAVRYIQMGKMSKREKDRIAASNEKNDKHEQEAFQNRVLEDATPRALDHVAHNDRARRGVAKAISV